MAEFLCIQQFFNVVNEAEGLITKLSGQENKFSRPKVGFTSFTSTGGARYDNYSFTQQKIDNNNNNPSTNLEIRCKVHPSKLNGTEVFWKIVQEANNTEVMEKSRDFLNKLYTQFSPELLENSQNIQNTFIETYLDRLSKSLDDPNAYKKGALNRMIKLMSDMIDESERKGTGGIKSHSAITKGDIINYTVKNNATNGKTIPKVMDIETYSNTTIWEIKMELGKFIECSPDFIRIHIGSKEIKDTDNGKTIGEFNKSSLMSIFRKNMDDIPKVSLLNEDKSLTSRAIEAFTEIFEKFAHNGKMDEEDAANFIRTTTGEKSVTPKDSRVKHLFTNFDKNKDGLLEQEDFLEFYRSCILNKKEDTVRSNLLVYGFRNDMKRLNEITSIPVDLNTLPRYILSRNQKSFDLLFKALDFGGLVAEQVWDLVCRLTTNEIIYEKIKKISEENDETTVEWENIIDTKSTFRFLYSLQIIESFLENTAVSEEILKWRLQFAKKGGIQFLLNSLISNDPTKIATKHEKETIATLQEIMIEFIKSSCFAINPVMYSQLKLAHAQYKKSSTSSIKEEKSLAESPTQSDKGAESPDKNESKKEENIVVNFEDLFKVKPSKIIFPKGYHLAQLKDLSNKTPIYYSKFDESLAKSIIELAEKHNLLEKELNLIGLMIFNDKIRDFLHSDQKLIKSAMNLFASYLCSAPKEVNLLKSYKFNEKTFDSLLNEGLLSTKSQPIREEFALVLYLLCNVLSKNTSISEYILDILLKIINSEKISSKSTLNYTEFFHLLCKLIDLHYSAPSPNKTFDPQELLTRLVNMLKKYEPKSKDDDDSLLQGILNTIRKILDHEISIKDNISLKEGLLGELFYNCLFPAKPLAIEQKCNTTESRSAAYKLLATICRGSLSSQLSLIKDFLEPLCTSIKPYSGWGYMPSAESRSKLGYAGIKNPGCICYMNSMLQQFYTIPTFRYNLLAANDGLSGQDKENDDNVLHQLLRMFSFLEFTERQCYNPRHFCDSFKDIDGNPTNMSVQQDAQEFLNVAFDRIENSLFKTAQKYLLRSVFGGKTCSQIICKGGCGNVRKNYEDFYNLSLGVKGFRTLHESLTKFVAGDTIQDYYCEQCKKKVDVVKRTSVSELPNVLIIHLQRIVYNYDTNMNDKINSRLEFPKDFSMEPYTLEGLENDKNAKNESSYYHYKLAGVVVHVGFAQAGHYYSYINVNRRKNKNDTDLFTSPQKDNWIEFNDSTIRPFEYFSHHNV